MIPLIYLGFISFVSSFSISHFITKEYLRSNFVIQPAESKKNSKVKFNTEIKFRRINHNSCLSPNTINKLWYTKKDYEKFKDDYEKLKGHYEKFKKYNSI